MTTPTHPWATVCTERTALLVAHNTTTLNRLLDVAGVLAGDLRIQCLVTADLTDPFADRLASDVETLGLASIPWNQATSMPFDLVVSASHHGLLEELDGPLVLLPHGAGFGKFAPGDGTAPRGAFGLAPEWVVRDGRPVAAALALPHQDHVEQLAADAPDALAAAVVVGDPCYDRLLAALQRRPAYRAALGVADDEHLVLVSSTWGAGGLLGACPDVVGRLIGELPRPGVKVALVAHPNVWAWHGAFQLRAWFADAVDAGLLVVPPLLGWQAALVACDAVVGDHGSVTVYGAALGRPTLLAAFPDHDVVPGSAAHRVGALARRIDPATPLRRQLDAALAAPPAWSPEVAALVTSAPGEAATRLAALFSRLLRLDPPLAATPSRPYPAPVADPH